MEPNEMAQLVLETERVWQAHFKVSLGALMVMGRNLFSSDVIFHKVKDWKQGDVLA